MGDKIKPSRPEEIRSAVRENYAEIARAGGNCCGPSTSAASGCCGPESRARRVGYSEQEITSVPAGADLGLGCGNPQAIANLREGETVLDLGSGGGFDAFLAARQVGGTGTVIGVDMTPEMIARARDNARKIGARNVEFRLGEIEHLPVADRTVDVIISNCVINLSPDKRSVFQEAFRVLRPGGRLAISDVVATSPIPAEIFDEISAYTGCVSGAVPVSELEDYLRDIGFSDIRIEIKPESRHFIKDWLPGLGAERYVASAIIEAQKP